MEESMRITDYETEIKDQNGENESQELRENGLE